jgi:hypothetical protein
VRINSDEQIVFVLLVTVRPLKSGDDLGPWKGMREESSKLAFQEACPAILARAYELRVALD